MFLLSPLNRSSFYTLIRFLAAVLLSLAVSVTNLATAEIDTKTTFGLEQRVACQTTIEDIRWAHRLWPEENPAPKPPRSGFISDAQIYAKVEDNLRMEAALRGLYGVEITSVMVQAELDRIARNTKAPDRLKELFEAFQNEPVLIAECLVRPALVKSRLYSRYVWDNRYHGDLKERAENVLSSLSDPSAISASGGGENLFALVRKDTLDEQNPDYLQDNNSVQRIELSTEKFDREVARLTNLPESSPAISPLRETQTAFIYEEVLSQSEDTVVIRNQVWPKDTFNAWWLTHSKQWKSDQNRSAASKIKLPTITGDVKAGVDNLSIHGLADSWQANQDPAPTGRAVHTAIWTGSEMIIWGGYDRTFTDTGGRYNPVTDNWTATSSVGAADARYYHSAVWTGSEMIVWGGLGRDNIRLNTGGRYNPSTDSWSLTNSSNAPHGREDHTAIWAGSEMIVWGGIHFDGGSAQRLNTGGRYDPVSNTWIATSTDSAPSERDNHSAIWTGSEMIIWGGYGGGTRLSTGGRYSPDTDSWIPTNTSDAPTGRLDHGAVWNGDKMVVWGGQDGKLINTGGRYDPIGDTWLATNTDDAPSGRIGHTTVWSGNEMIIWGGYDGTRLSTGGRYSPDTDSWTNTDVGNAPNGRTGHSGVWTGSEMIIWGGSVTGLTNTGGRYNPATNSWTIMDTSGDAPLGRYAHTAIWTGNEMLIWGGYGGDYSNTGHRYEPAIDRWADITIEEAPSGRGHHTAVWTGSEMIIWGGPTGGIIPLGTGGRYDPNTDSWIETNTEGAPDGRFFHTAVWSGGEMIIWGGTDGYSYLNSGGRYSPNTDSWQATNTDGAPSHREGHTAVWNGSEMIVWGGVSNTGGRYDPMSDTWVEVSTEGAPSGYYNGTTIWTGSEMIVWGGSYYDAGYQYSSSGGRYDPITDNWLETTLDNVPDSRESHTAIWSGSEMIVWGGNNVEPLNTGGRYDPFADQWDLTSTVEAPNGREGHTAVWTGSQMIIWGGQPVTNQYGSYFPHNNYSSCTPDILTLGPITYMSGDVVTEQAENDIDTRGEVLLLSGAIVAYESATSVTLNPGFRVSADSEFKASILPITCP